VWRPGFPGPSERAYWECPSTLLIRWRHYVTCVLKHAVQFLAESMFNSNSVVGRVLVTVTFPVAGHRCPATRTNLYCLVAEAQCVQTTCPRSFTWQRNGRELNSRPLESQANAGTITPPGHRRSGIALAMRHRLKWFIHLRAQGLSKGDEHPTNTPHGIWYSLPF